MHSSKKAKYIVFVIAYSFSSIFGISGQQSKTFGTEFTSPILFKGNQVTAYRDPAVVYENNRFFLFFTLVRVEEDNKIYSYVAMSTSSNLHKWTRPKILTPRDQQLDFSSPGNIVRDGQDWVLCLQTYPRPDYMVSQMPKFGTGAARIFTMRSKDLKTWSRPALLRVKGNNVTEKEMGRMIDPYLIADKNKKGKWWCFYKQNGVSMSYSDNLHDWTYSGRTDAGENVCVLAENDEYILLHSIKNGMAIKHSKDLKTWSDREGIITLGQDRWDWAKGRITAGTLINLKANHRFGKYVMFFHGSGPLTEEQGDFDKNASIGFAWSNDLINWDWPGKK